MNVTKLAQEIEKSRRFSPKGEVYIVQHGQKPLKIEKVRTKGDMVLLYLEEDDATAEQVSDSASFLEG